MKSSNLTQLTSSENQPQSSQLKSKTEYSFHPPYQIEFSNEINQDKSSIGKNGEQSHIDSNSDKGRNIDEFIRRISSVERHIKKIMVFKNLEKNFRDIMETCKVMVTQRNIQEFLNLYSQTLRDHQDWIVKNTLRTSQSELESQKSLNASNTQIINETAPKTSKSKNEKLTENSNLSRLSSNQSLESIPATSIDVISLLIS